MSKGSRRQGPKQAKGPKQVPFPFVLELLEPLRPTVKPMFGLSAIYVGKKIVLILRDRDEHREDNGVWAATALEHLESLQREFPEMRSLGEFGGGVTSWQVLPSASADFEASVMRMCELILRGDQRIGKIPKRKSKRL